MGRAACEILVALGSDVVGVDIQTIEADGAIRCHVVDLADAASIDAAVDAIGGPVDALFNCAGIPGTAEARTILSINFCGLRRFTEGIVASMPRGSAICSIGSAAAVNWPYHVDAFLELLALGDDAEMLDWLDSRLSVLGYPYDVSKEAVNVYTAWRAIGLNELGIRMKCVNPGGTFTPASREFSKAVRAKDFGAEMIEHWPRLMGRMARPGEQAWPMVFLNSPFASFVNGASLRGRRPHVGAVHAPAPSQGGGRHVLASAASIRRRLTCTSATSCSSVGCGSLRRATRCSRSSVRAPRKSWDGCQAVVRSTWTARSAPLGAPSMAVNGLGAHRSSEPVCLQRSVDDWATEPTSWRR